MQEVYKEYINGKREIRNDSYTRYKFQLDNNLISSKSRYKGFWNYDNCQNIETYLIKIEKICTRYYYDGMKFSINDYILTKAKNMINNDYEHFKKYMY